VVFAYIHSSWFDEDFEVDEILNSDELAECANQLLNTDPSHGFLFKGTENIEKVS